MNLNGTQYTKEKGFCGDLDGGRFSYQIRQPERYLPKKAVNIGSGEGFGIRYKKQGC
jgi:hypothetical protein